MNGPIRLDKLLANLGYGSRRDVQGLARNGRVVLDGVPWTDSDKKIDFDAARRLRVDDAVLDPLPGLVVMVHKPIGMTCSRDEAGPLVYDLLPERWRRRDPPLSTVGRLDKDTSGLLLITDDGGLLHRIISPKAHIPKRYRATLDAPLRGDESAIFASGDLMLKGESKPLLPAELAPIDDGGAFVTVREGRYHQVRRMFAAVGNHVTALHRDRVGALALPTDLTSGTYRVLEAMEIEAIFT